MTAQQRGKRKTRVGTVVSDKMNRTLVVDVERVYRHPLYEKVVRSNSRCYVHDEKGEARSGDMVRIVECRPISRLKKWRILEVVKKSRGARGGAGTEEEIKELNEELRGKQETPPPAEGVEGVEAVDEAGETQTQN